MSRPMRGRLATDERLAVIRLYSERHRSVRKELLQTNAPRAASWEGRPGRVSRGDETSNDQH